MSFIIDPSSISQSQIESDILTYLQSQPDAARWKDFFNSSVGKQLIKIVAGLGSFLQYNIITARRETFLPYVANKTSAIAASGSLGYSTYRGRNAVVELTISPNISSLITKYSVIGTVKDKDLVLLEDTVFNAGVPKTILAVVGDRLDESLVASGNTPTTFKFSNSKVSQDVRVLLNEEEVQISERILDLINQKFVVQTNVNESVNVMYLNLDTFSTRYSVGDTISIQYIELNNLVFSLSDIICDIGTILTSSFESTYQDPETIESIKINAPLFHETQYTIRGRDDYMKAFKLLDADIIDTNYKDISPAVIQLTYVNDDLSLYSGAQLFQFVTRLSSFRPMGVEPPTVRHSTPVFLTLNISVKLLNSSGNPAAEVAAIISDKEGELEKLIVFADLEKEIESLSFTKISRTEIASTTWASNTRYVRGHHVKPSVDNGKIYEMYGVVYKSGSTIPDFLNGTAPYTDNELTWCEEDRVLCSDDSIEEWQPNTIYNEGDYVVIAPIVINGTTANTSDTITGISSTSNIKVGMLITGANIPANTFVISKTASEVVMSKEATGAGAGIPITFILMKKFRVCDFINKSNTSIEIQGIAFNPTPSAGTFRLEFSGESTVDLPYNATASQIQTALNNLSGLSGVTVTGAYNTGLQISFGGSDANQDQPELSLSDPGQNEVQCLSFDFVPNSGAMVLNFNGQNTAALGFNATPATIQSALELLPTIGSGNILVTGSISPSKTLNFTFVNNLGLSPQPNLTVTTNTLITGTNVTATPSTLTEGVSATSGQNEEQLIQFSSTPTTGTFSLTYEAVTTTPLTFNASTAQIQTALEALSSIGSGNIVVTGSIPTLNVEFVNGTGLSNRNLIFPSNNSLARAQDVTVTISTTQGGGGGFNEIQKIDFNYKPDIGNWKLKYGSTSFETPVLNSTITSATLQTYLESMQYITTGDLTYSSVNLTGSVTSNSATVTVSSTAGLTSGMSVSGTYIPTNAKINTIVNATQFTMDSNATATSTAVPLTFVNASATITNMTTSAIEVGNLVSGSGIAAGSKVLSKTATSVTLNNKVTASGTAVTLTFTKDNTGNVEVTGDFNNGFNVFFRGSLTNTDVPALVVSSNTLKYNQPTTINVTATTEGESPTVGVSEVQKITFNKVPDSGTYTLSFMSSTTSPINYNSIDSVIQIALELLPSIGVGNIAVVGDYTNGFTITFQGSLANSPQSQITVASSSLYSSSAPVVITNCTGIDGRTPANNLTSSGNPVDAIVTQVTDGINPEPDWFSGAVIC